jgi:hypothetical protein
LLEAWRTFLPLPADWTRTSRAKRRGVETPELASLYSRWTIQIYAARTVNFPAIFRPSTERAVASARRRSAGSAECVNRLIRSVYCRLISNNRIRLSRLTHSTMM